MSSKTFDRKDITAVEARELVEEVDWDDFINNKIKQRNEQIRKFAKHGYQEVRVGLWPKEQYVWNKLTEHFELKGFEVRREWCGLVLKW